MAKAIKECVAEYLSMVSTDWKINLISNWKCIVGDLHDRVRLDKIDGTILILGVYDPHWMQELYLLSRTIITIVNNYLGNDYITDLRFRIAHKRPASVKKSQYVHIDVRVAHLTTEQHNLLMTIKDPELQVILKKLLYTRVMHHE